MSMKMRSFGKLGISGSAFGLGCMRFPMVEKDGKKVVDEENAIRIIRTAIDGGVTYLDTAYVYLGQQSERVVGKALQDLTTSLVCLMDVPVVAAARFKGDIEDADLAGGKGRGSAALL